MKHIFLTILVILVAISCYAAKERKQKNRQILLSDTALVVFKPNRVVKTEQFYNGDSLKRKITKIEYYHDSLIISETYRDYMTSEYDGAGDGDYYYYYNKNKKLIRRDFIEKFLDEDTVRQFYRYPNDRVCNITEFDCRRRLKANMPHGDLISEKDKTKKRIWLYNTSWTNTYNEKNKLIEYYEPLKDKSITDQNRYTYKYENDKLMEECSFLNDTILYYKESYEYKDNQITMTHVNYDLKDNAWSLPFYSEISKLDKNGNTVLIEKYDDKGILMRRYVNLYDNNNRLIRMECFDENNKLRVTHNLYYETL